MTSVFGQACCLSGVMKVGMRSVVMIGRRLENRGCRTLVFLTLVVGWRQVELWKLHRKGVTLGGVQ